MDALRDAVAGWEQITADAARTFASARGGDGERAYRKFITLTKSEHSHQWIANLAPPYAEILDAVRHFLIELYGKRATAFGYSRFGIKETRCDLATARSLRLLFPSAKFIFLVRDPIAVTLSIKRRGWIGRNAGLRTLFYFSEHWRRRASEFRTADFGMAVRYEDFVRDSMLRKRLMEYLEIEHSPDDDFVESSKVDWKTRDRSGLTVWERCWLRYWLADEMSRWGYK